MRVGDKIDFKTGAVTKKPPEPVEPTDEEEIVKP
jgi:hypothetical protein